MSASVSLPVSRRLIASFALHECYLIAGNGRAGEELGPRGKNSPKRERQRYKPRANLDPMATILL
jgi:hypothetical protein